MLRYASGALILVLAIAAASGTTTKAQNAAPTSQHPLSQGTCCRSCRRTASRAIGPGRSARSRC